jgi:pimeloyl-ACP methyl ester carboxylesterase
MSKAAEYLPSLFGQLSGRRSISATPPADPHPLLVAIHGGTYTSRYFDLPGFSFLNRASARGLPILAPDRPSYGESIELDEEHSTLRGSAQCLEHALADAWDRYRGSSRGIVLVAHSIGAAVSMLVASMKPQWPLLGLAISGVGLRTPPGHREAWAALPATYRVEIPSALKDQVMFGPPGSFDERMPGLSHIADAPAPKAELVDIVSTWHEQVRAVASQISVPVHYRQGEFDGLWIVDESEVAGFGAAFKNSIHVDAALAIGVGHCIDFHRRAEEFHTGQLDFAMRCAAGATQRIP